MRVLAPRTGRRVAGPLAGLFAIALLLALLGPARAAAVERVYWENTLQPSALGFADVGGAGGSLSTAGSEVEFPAGLGYDPVDRRFYYVDEGAEALSRGHIAYVNQDGTGGGVLSPEIAVATPRGIAVDPTGRMIYWYNRNTKFPYIAGEALAGGHGLVFSPENTVAGEIRRLTVDPGEGRLYWGNQDGAMYFGALDLSNGGMLLANGEGTITGLAVDRASDRVFWTEEGVDQVFVGSLGAGGRYPVNTGSAPVDDPWGLAFDPTQGRLYWTNYGNGTDPAGVVGYVTLGTGVGGGISPAGAPVNGPKSTVVIKSPTSTGAPQVGAAGAQLSCSPGSWAADAVASSVFQAPRGYAYQWTLNDAPVAGATAPTYTANAAGRYRCVVTATNEVGSTSRTSGGVNVTVTTTTRPGKTRTWRPARLELLGKSRHLKARPGKLLALKVRTTNEGTVASTPAKLCLKLTKGAKRALRAGKCRRLGALRGGATDVAKLRLRVKRSADPGLYKLRITVPGSQTKVTVRVLG